MASSSRGGALFFFEVRGAFRTSQMLADFGPKWLTEAFHRAGQGLRHDETAARHFGKYQQGDVLEDRRHQGLSRPLTGAFAQVTGGNNAGKFLLSVKCLI